MGISEYVNNISTLFKNITLNALGVERDLYQLLEDKDVTRAISLMKDNDADVDNALKEYYPQKHKIMERKNKPRKNMSPYITCKLPRALQRYINEVELSFLFGNPMLWEREDGDEEAYTLFLNFIKSSRFNSTMRKVKRIAGSETEAAKLYHIYRNNENEVFIKPVVLARSTGYKLRPLFDQYGELVAFGYGYTVKNANGKNIEHWDIQTPQMIFECSHDALIGWNVTARPNPTGKINILYYQQRKAWDGVEPRIERIEDTDSKIGDTNNMFAEPIAFATADVVEMMKDPDSSGKLIKGTKDARFEYINPPAASELRDSEKRDLMDSVLFDSFTPNLSVEALTAMSGELSGVAVKRLMSLGYLKRSNLMEIYEEMVDREKNIIIAALKVQHPEMANKLDTLKIKFTFAEPFDEDKHTEWSSITGLYAGGLVSLERAVEMLSLTNSPQEEVDKIRMAATEQLMAEAELKAEQEQSQGVEPTQNPTEQTKPTEPTE